MGRLVFRTNKIPDKEMTGQGNEGQRILFGQISGFECIDKQDYEEEKQEKTLEKGTVYSLGTQQFSGEIHQADCHRTGNTLYQENTAATAEQMAQGVDQENDRALVVKKICI